MSEITLLLIYPTEESVSTERVHNLQTTWYQCYFNQEIGRLSQNRTKHVNYSSSLHNPVDVWSNFERTIHRLGDRVKIPHRVFLGRGPLSCKRRLLLHLSKVVKLQGAPLIL